MSSTWMLEKWVFLLKDLLFCLNYRCISISCSWVRIGEFVSCLRSWLVEWGARV